MTNKIDKFNIELSDFYYSFKHSRDSGYIFQYIEDSSYNGRFVTVNGKKLLHFASCGYLGVERHPLLVEAAIEALKKYGTQTPSSRAILSSPYYKELENILPSMFPGYQIVTQTVTLAHCAALPALIGENDAIILDAYAHNSMRMASQICKAKGTFVVVAKHNDIENVKYLIYRLKKEGRKHIWYCADGIYSLHGNKCDVGGLIQLLNEEENFFAYVDDAHGTGWCGKNGAGYVIDNFGLHEKMIVVVSFAKSMSTSGGALIVPDRLLAEFLQLTGQTMIFSGPIQPPIIAALIACVKLHLSDEIKIYQENLLNLIKYFRAKSVELNLSFVTRDETPIQLIRIGDHKNTDKVMNKLINKGFLPSQVLFPAIAKGDEGIRITITTHLTKDDIDSLLENLNEILTTEGLLN
jgi:7-keto-8-aminopelargonate synthetase-like enzyme